MTNTFDHVENMLEESSALFECYLERVMESESINDLISASHWYTDAVFSLMTYPTQR
ncbi:hypothetical protein [Neptuniibacter halophilus]|uniref:hypothetical protein n=1 Tax=Neptuniibacter halophilus TaxID=651666 RepID=UPI002573462E|nr:hypothetical protein [Neptuniibacter halophilus]